MDRRRIGSATTGTTTPLVVNQVTALAPMYPGDVPQTISGTFNNPNDGPIRVTKVTASVDDASGTCDPDDFTVDNTAAQSPQDVVRGSSKGSWTGPTIRSNNKSSENQDDCKGATVTLAFEVA